MTWFVQYRLEHIDRIGRYPSPESAIKAACLLMDDGVDVFGIGSGELSDSVDSSEIAKIYGIWARAKHPRR